MRLWEHIQDNFFEVELPSPVNLVITSPSLRLLSREPLAAIFKRLSSVLASTGWILLDMPVGYTPELVNLHAACRAVALQPKWFILQEDMYVAGETQSLYCITWTSRHVTFVPLKRVRELRGHGASVKIKRTEPMRHRCEFCATWIEELIHGYSAVGDVVLDAFCGTGTVPRIAAELGRQGYGIDVRDIDL